MQTWQTWNISVLQCVLNVLITHHEQIRCCQSASRGAVVSGSRYNCTLSEAHRGSSVTHRQQCNETITKNSNCELVCSHCAMVLAHISDNVKEIMQLSLFIHPSIWHMGWIWVFLVEFVHCFHHPVVHIEAFEEERKPVSPSW